MKKVRKIEQEPLVSKETRLTIIAIVFFLASFFFVLSAFSRAGVAGDFVYYYLHLLFGAGFFLAPLVLFLAGVSFLKQSHGIVFLWTTIIGACMFLIAGLGATEIIFGVQTGGMVGTGVAFPVVKLFDTYFALVALIGVSIVGVLVMFNTSITLTPILFGLPVKRPFFKEPEDKKMEKDAEIKPHEPEEVQEPLPVAIPTIAKIFKNSEKKDAEEDIIPHKDRWSADDEAFTLPPLALLEKDSGKPGVGDIKANANAIKRTLGNFGIVVEIDEISIGPSVTRYALKPAEGVKLSRIVGLANELALALAAHPIRVEAPIPGKSLVGIEIPNNVKTRVGLGTLLSSDEYRTSSAPLLLSAGRGTSGVPAFTDLAKLPHLLIAGTTGSGKSVTIHTLILSLLYRNSPRDLKFIMIDPKRVELTLYNSIPHLLTPVITDAKKAILALKWAAKEMDRRYNVLEHAAVRDIASYHKTIVEPTWESYRKQKDKRKNKDEEDEATRAKLPETMPYVVIIIDELADMMTTYPRELEAAIVRIAQISRAVGIHLIVSTQRPSVEVITGLIKANVPARMALQVASQIDSRTIIDMPGAEKLLGQGDMLFLAGDTGKPKRLQSAFVSEAEVKRVAKYLRDHETNGVPDELTFSESGASNAIFESTIGNDAGEDDDELYEEAREAIIKAGKASSSYLQRKLKVGYARAARLLDILEERGVVGPQDGSKPREVYGASEPTEVPEEKQA